LSLRLDDGRTFADLDAAIDAAEALSKRDGRAVDIAHLLDGRVSWTEHVDVAATRNLATETLRRLDTIDDAEHVAALSRALVADDWADMTDATVEARIALGDSCSASGCTEEVAEPGDGYCSRACWSRDNGDYYA
jgi:hypothetical protein